MKKRVLCCLVLALALCALLPTAVLADELPYVSYTYDEDWNEMPQPAIYQPEGVLAGTGFEAPSDMCVYENTLYVLDGACVYTFDAELNPLKTIALQSQSSGALAMGQSGGLYVCDWGIYASDKTGRTVYRFTLDGSYVAEYRQPESALYDTSVPFSVSHIVVDGAGNVYALVEGLYAGAVLFSQGGDFLGFYGSNEVSMTGTRSLDQFWKSLLSSEQRAAMERFVPVAYTSFAIDSDNFIYTVSADAETVVSRIRKLNPTGKGLWDSETKIFGDFSNDYVEGISNATRFVDIEVDADGFITALDAAKGRVFRYDQNGNTVGVFGGRGSQVGTFTDAASLAVIGSRVYVLDAKDNSITLFAQTEYGVALHTALLLYNDGAYLDAMPHWQQVLAHNSSSQMACVGMGKALYAAGDVAGALFYLRRSGYQSQYSAVFAGYRLAFVRQHFTLLVLGLAAAITVVLILKRLGWPGIGRLLRPLKKHMGIMLHPTKGIEELVRTRQLSLGFSTGVLVVWLALDVLSYFGTGFIFNSNDPAGFNMLQSVMTTVGLYLMWVLANWSLSTLTQGKGTARVIYCASAYALLPYIFSMALRLVLSRVLVEDEGAFLTWVTAVGLLWSALLLVCLVMAVHHYTLEKAAVNILLTMVGILIVVFLVFLLVVLFGHVIGLGQIVFNEITLRR